MKVAATKYMQEENRAKADKEEKLSKFRDSAADAAARVIQMMYYVFSVSGWGEQAILAEVLNPMHRLRLETARGGGGACCGRCTGHEGVPLAISLANLSVKTPLIIFNQREGERPPNWYSFECFGFTSVHAHDDELTRNPVVV